MEKIRVAVIGCGSISDIYMSNITEGKFQILELVACSDLYPAAAQAKAEKYGCKVMTTEEICADCGREEIEASAKVVDNGALLMSDRLGARAASCRYLKAVGSVCKADDLVVDENVGKI